MDHDTRDAIRRMIRYISDDAKIARNVALPSQGITADTVASMRRSMRISGDLGAQRRIGTGKPKNYGSCA